MCLDNVIDKFHILNGLFLKGFAMVSEETNSQRLLKIYCFALGFRLKFILIELHLIHKSDR